MSENTSDDGGSGKMMLPSPESLHVAVQIEMHECMKLYNAARNGLGIEDPNAPVSEVQAALLDIFHKEMETYMSCRLACRFGTQSAWLAMHNMMPDLED